MVCFGSNSSPSSEHAARAAVFSMVLDILVLGRGLHLRLVQLIELLVALYIVDLG